MVVGYQLLAISSRDQEVAPTRRNCPTFRFLNVTMLSPISVLVKLRVRQL